MSVAIFQRHRILGGSVLDEKETNSRTHLNVIFIAFFPIRIHAYKHVLDGVVVRSVFK